MDASCSRYVSCRLWIHIIYLGCGQVPRNPRLNFFIFNRISEDVNSNVKLVYDVRRYGQFVCIMNLLIRNRFDRQAINYIILRGISY